MSDFPKSQKQQALAQLRGFFVVSKYLACWRTAKSCWGNFGIDSIKLSTNSSVDFITTSKEHGSTLSPLLVSGFLYKVIKEQIFDCTPQFWENGWLSCAIFNFNEIEVSNFRAWDKHKWRECQIHQQELTQMVLYLQILTIWLFRMGIFSWRIISFIEGLGLANFEKRFFRRGFMLERIKNFILII